MKTSYFLFSTRSFVIHKVIIVKFPLPVMTTALSMITIFLYAIAWAELIYVGYPRAVKSAVLAI